MKYQPQAKFSKLFLVKSVRYRNITNNEGPYNQKVLVLHLSSAVVSEDNHVSHTCYEKVWDMKLGVFFDALPDILA